MMTCLPELGVNGDNCSIGQGLQLGIDEGLKENTGGGGGRGHKGKNNNLKL